LGLPLYHRCFHNPAKEIGITRNIDTRVMRHFYITYMLEMGIDKFDLKSVTGHASFKMIDEVYREVTDDTNKRLQKVSTSVLNLIEPQKQNNCKIIQFPTVS